MWRCLAETLVVAIDPGKIVNRVWLASGERGLIGEPVSLPTLRAGVEELARLVARSGVPGAPVIAVEATGSLHRAWTAELERRSPVVSVCLLRRRRRRRGRSWDRGASSQTIVTVLRWSGLPGRGSVVCPRSRSWRRCSGWSDIAASSSPSSRSSVNASTISSIASARVCRRRGATAVRLTCCSPRGGRYSPAPSPSGPERALAVRTRPRSADA